MVYILEYVWIDNNNNLRNKIRVSENPIPIVWNFDGSSTGQATTEKSEIFLKPVYNCRNPFYTYGYIVLCAVYNDFECTIPNEYNTFEKYKDVVNDNSYWFGFEQEYFLINGHVNEPINEGSDKYYCGVGSENVFARYISDEHLTKCMNAGLSICGTNSEVSPNQWEYQIGIVKGIDSAHQLWISRYILLRIAEKYNLKVIFDPKPYNELNGSGCHINFSTTKTRGKNGLEYMKNVIFPKLESSHASDIAYYGKDNHKRLTGKHETANIASFSWGIGSRNTSVRIGHETEYNGRGYFEDRRPASNCDPYLVCMLLVNNSS